MSAPSIGYLSSRPNDEAVPLLSPDFSKVGYCTTSEDADPSVFPLNEPVRFQSTDPRYLSKAGTGYLADALAGLNAQLRGRGADVCAVRVAEGTGNSAAERLDGTFANIIGDAGAQTGLWALRAAGQHVKMIPRLIGVPGYTAQQPDGEEVDNPVRAALAPHLDALKAISIVDVDTSTSVKAIAARELMSSDRMMPLGVAAKVYQTIDGASTLVTRPMSPRILGLIVNSDNNYRDGKPFDSFCNKAVLGLAGVNRAVNFDLSDGSTEAQIMLAADVSVVVRGATADDGAIADGGFTFLGVESAATGDLWSQIHQVRAADYIDLEMAKITRQYLGGRITPRRAEAWLEALRNKLIDHVNDEDILGFEMQFPEEINSIDDVRLGTLSINTNIEPAPVFRRANNTVRRYRPAVQALIDAIVAQAGSFSAVVA